MFKLFKTAKLHAEAKLILQELLEAPEFCGAFESKSYEIADECVNRIATQNPELKELWKGQTPHAIAYAMSALSLNIHVDLISKDTDPTFVMGLTGALSELVMRYGKTGVILGFSKADHFAAKEAAKTANAAQKKIHEVFWSDGDEPK